MACGAAATLPLPFFAQPHHRLSLSRRRQFFFANSLPNRIPVSRRSSNYHKRVHAKAVSTDPQNALSVSDDDTQQNTPSSSSSSKLVLVVGASGGVGM